MAELDSSGGGGKKKGGKVRSKKQNARVDMTPMVDLMFLLITFFMLTTTLAKPQAMDLAMPDKDEKNDDKFEVADTRTMTILLGARDRLEWYIGSVDKPISAPQLDNYGKKGIRKAILDKIKEVRAKTGKGLIVLIKASDKSNYKNLVDILDEMKITNVGVNGGTYAIVDITEPEIGLLKRDGIF